MRAPSVIAAAFVALAFGIGWAASAFQVTQDAPRARHATDTAQRVKEWAYVAREKALSPSEDLRMVIVPSEFGRHFDVRCLIYRNRDVGSVTFTCPEARQDQLEEGPQ